MHTIPSLPIALSREFTAQLCGSLPPPLTDTPDSIEARNGIAKALLADLRPATISEAQLAVQVVLTCIHAQDCFRLATEHRDDFAKSARCRDQALCMSRQAQRDRTALQLMQVQRHIAPAEPLLSQSPEPAALPPVATPHAENSPTQSTPPPAPEALAKAEEYALEHLEIAAELRLAGGLTPGAAARIPPALLPADPAMLAALVHGDSEFLRQVDELGRGMLRAA